MVRWQCWLHSHVWTASTMVSFRVISSSTMESRFSQDMMLIFIVWWSHLLVSDWQTDPSMVWNCDLKRSEGRPHLHIYAYLLFWTSQNLWSKWTKSFKHYGHVDVFRLQTGREPRATCDSDCPKNGKGRSGRSLKILEHQYVYYTYYTHII